MEKNRNKRFIIALIFTIVAVIACVFFSYSLGKKNGTANNTENPVVSDTVNESLDSFPETSEADPVLVDQGYDDEKSKTYIEAKDLLSEKKYEEARVLFLSISGYSDSDEMISECDYQKALFVLESEDYSGAASLFEKLGNYRDSADKIKECSYRKAKNTLDDKRFDDAKEMFMKLGDYSNSSYMTKVCDMEHGLELVREDCFDEAVPYFVELLKDEEWLTEFSKGRLQDETNVSGYDLDLNPVTMKRQVMYYGEGIGGIIIDYIDDDDIPDRYRVRPNDKDEPDYDFGDYEYDGNWKYLYGCDFRPHN